MSVKHSLSLTVTVVGEPLLHAYEPIGNVCIYCLLFVCFLHVFVCTVTDFSAKDKRSGIKFCVVVYGRPEQAISHF